MSVFAELPTDTITDVKVNNDFIFVSSWDNRVYMYNYKTKNFVQKFSNNYPILKLAYTNQIIFADAAGSIHFGNDKEINVNIHGIRALELHNNRLIIGGLSKNIILLNENGLLEKHNVNQKVYGSNLSENALALNHGYEVCLYDLRMFKPLKIYKNKYIVRSIFINTNILYFGDVNGRITVVDQNTSDSYIINAHYNMINKDKVVYPINDLKYDDGYLLSVGSDGIIYRWKSGDKLVSHTMFKSEIGIVKIEKLNPGYVVCSSYNYEKGEGNTRENQIHLI